MIAHLSNKAEFYWQIRELVYLNRDEAVGYDRWLLLISVSRKNLARRTPSNRTDNRHRWAGREDQGEREKVV